MASTYRDAVGVERPTQWERTHPAYPGVVDLLTPATYDALDRLDGHVVQQFGEQSMPDADEWASRQLCIAAHVAERAGHVTYMDAWWGQQPATAAYIIMRDGLPSISDVAAAEVDGEMRAYAKRLRDADAGRRLCHWWER